MIPGIVDPDEVRCGVCHAPYVRINGGVYRVPALTACSHPPGDAEGRYVVCFEAPTGEPYPARLCGPWERVLSMKPRLS